MPPLPQDTIPGCIVQQSEDVNETWLRQLVVVGAACREEDAHPGEAHDLRTRGGVRYPVCNGKHSKGISTPCVQEDNDEQKYCL